MEVIKTIQAAPGRWTITDSHLSPDNQRCVQFTVQGDLMVDRLRQNDLCVNCEILVMCS